MKRHFKPQPPTAQQLHLSAEEEAIAADEQNEVKIEEEHITNNADQLGDIITTIGDVQTVVSNIPEIKPIDEALVSAAADMATAGTDADPEELVGTMLPDEGVSTESLMVDMRDRLAKLKENLPTKK